MRIPVLVIIHLLIYTSISAQVTDKIETDRPDQTESPYTVPKNWFQAEAGFGIAKDKSDAKTFVHPTLLSKYGLSRRFELRLITDYVSLQTPLLIPSGNKVSSGLQPIEIGGKLALFEEKGLRPKTSLIFHTSIPKAAFKEFQQPRWGPNFRFTMQHTLNETISVGYNLGAEWDGEEETNPTYIYTLTSGFNLGENWYAYAELFGFINSSTPPQHNVDGGVAFNFSSHTRIDLSYGLGITSQTSLKSYLALGFSFRLPLRKS
jgi:hypothetical protein